MKLIKDSLSIQYTPVAMVGLFPLSFILKYFDCILIFVYYRTWSTTDLPAREALRVLQSRVSPREETPTTPTPTWTMTTRSTWSPPSARSRRKTLTTPGKPPPPPPSIPLTFTKYYSFLVNAMKKRIENLVKLRLYLETS